MSVDAEPRRRRTQEERRAATRGALLDATVEMLVEHGYAGVTTTKVADAAGVSRGAQVHHFPTKAQLVTQAIAHLAERRVSELTADLQRIPAGPRRTEAVLDALWQAHSGPLFQASLELWVAARTDPELREHMKVVERRVNELTWGTAGDLFGELVERPGFRGDVETALATMRGLAVLAAMSGDGRRRIDRRWAEAKERLLRLLA